MKVILDIVGGPERGRRIELLAGNHLIGREAGLAVQLDSKAVSREHARIIVDEQGALLEDLGSANGTSINRTKIGEQKLSKGDTIYIGDYVIDVVAIHNEQLQEAIRKTKKEFSWSALTSLLSKAQRLYGNHNWRVLIMVVLLTVIAADHMILAHLFSQKLQVDSVQSEIARAKALVRYLGERNTLPLERGQEALLDAESIVAEAGIEAAFIVSPSARVLAPSYKINRQLDNGAVRKALAAQTDEVALELSADGQQLFVAVPIRRYNDDQASYSTIGAAVVRFSPHQLQSTLDASNRLKLLSLLAIPLVAFVLFFIIVRLTNTPLVYLTDNFGFLFRGEIERIDRKSAFVELIPLIDAANAAANRLKNASAGAAHSNGQQADITHPLDESQAAQARLLALLQAVSDAAIILDKNGMILAVNKKAGELLEIDVAQPLHLHLLEVIGHSGFRSFLEKQLEQFHSQSGPMLRRRFDLGDFAYQVSMVASGSAEDQRKSGVVIGIEQL